MENLWRWRRVGPLEKARKSLCLKPASTLEVVNAQGFGGIVGVGRFKLKDVYPTFFRLTSHKKEIVVGLWGREWGGFWEVCFKRPFQDWELENVSWFLELQTE